MLLLFLLLLLLLLLRGSMECCGPGRKRGKERDFARCKLEPEGAFCRFVDGGCGIDRKL
jgi:hypothetical protein